MFTHSVPPTKQEIQNRSRHPIESQRIVKQSITSLKLPAMQQQMIHSLLTTRAHATPPYQHITCLNEIITSKDPPPSRSPNKESNPRRSLNIVNDKCLLI
jgi:hypothetical protein